MFHAEHNRLVEANKATILETGDLAFINEWLRGPDITSIPANLATLNWDGERLFQAARFATEMQYQHMVFEEFARRIQPLIDPFVFTNTAEIDPSILAEFAHAVYRFGHSMLTDTVERLDNDLEIVAPGSTPEQITLIDAFLDPMSYIDGGADFEEIQGSLIRGMSRDLGNEIDEFIVPALRSNLLGLPLDLAALNIARARDTGVPSLNETRAQLFDDFGLADLRPYTSWQNFTQNIKNPLSVINFIAAYGTHASITSATTMADKRDAATLLVLGDGGAAGDVTIRGQLYTDRLAFLNASGAATASPTEANAAASTTSTSGSAASRRRRTSSAACSARPSTSSSSTSSSGCRTATGSTTCRAPRASTCSTSSSPTPSPTSSCATATSGATTRRTSTRTCS